MTTVKRILEQKGGKVWQIDADSTVFEAIRKLADKDVGSLVVMNGEKLVGIFTERQYARSVYLKGKSSAETLVKDIMETNVCCVRPKNTVEECMALMTEKRFRHLPVLDDDDLLVGLV
ncbi:MAG: CBS domain-containing protein, partial [Rhodospirillales bacterium]|nr:CBS domain-containing protein [Rhodospirillales bacterium]